MSLMIAAEHFSLTPGIRAAVEEAVERFSELIAPSAQMRVFLSHDADRSFTALFKVHFGRKELVAQSSEEDLYLAISHAALQIRREILKARRIRSAARRRPQAAV